MGFFQRMKYYACFLVNKDEKSYGCWITEGDPELYKVIQSSWDKGLVLKYEIEHAYNNGHTVQTYSSNSLNEILKMFWDVTEKFDWELINPIYIMDLFKKPRKMDKL